VNGCWVDASDVRALTPKTGEGVKIFFVEGDFLFAGGGESRTILSF